MKNALAYFRQKFPINRVVVLLTPLAATLAGLVAAWLADHAPLIADQVDEGSLTAIFIAAATSVVTMAYKWLDGWQDYEEQLADPEMHPVLAPSHVGPPPEVKEGGGSVGGLDDQALLSQPGSGTPDDVNH